MPSRHVNDAENNILKLISDHTKKAFYLFFGIKMIMILMEKFRKLARDFVRFISEDNLFPWQPIMVPWTDSVRHVSSQPPAVAALAVVALSTETCTFAQAILEEGPHIPRDEKVTFKFPSRSLILCSLLPT